MNDNALAPVIAVMLILAIGVTVFSVYTSTYLPGLKQQAEVEHLQQVESGFMKFSSDIDNAIAAGKAKITYSEQIPLGGGDIMLNSLKSSGTIRIRNESLGSITITNFNTTIPLNLVNFSYQPYGNFWIDQGYTWQEGYVNVTKGNRATPLQYNSIDDPNLKNTLSQFAGNLINYNSGSGTLQITRMIAGTNNVTSSNGVARLVLSTNVTSSDNHVQNASLIFVPTGDSSKFSDEIEASIDGINMALPKPENYVTVKIIEIKVEVN